MSQLLNLRQTIVDKVAALTGWTDVEGHFGRFTEQQLREFLMAAPAVRVAILALEQPQEVSDGGVDWVARIGLYVATGDGPEEGDRDEIAIAAVEAITRLCDRTNWGLGKTAGVRLGKVAGAQNLYSEKGMQDGIALWAIDLRQTIRIAPAEADAVDMTAMFYGLSPNVGPAHVGDYVELSAASEATS